MKTNILLGALLACSPITLANTQAFDFGRTDSQTENAINIYKGNDESDPSNLSGALRDLQGSYTIAFTKGGTYVSNGGIAPTLTDDEEAGNWKNAFGGDLPFGLGSSSADGLLVQTNGNNAAITLTFTGLKAGTYSLTAFGGFYGKDPMLNVTATLSSAADWSVQTTNASSGAWSDVAYSANATSYNFNNASTSTIDHGYAFTANGITVGEDGQLTLTLAGVGGEVYGRLPLNYVSLSLVPEPASTSLSLLALAGFAMRRRRK